MEGWPYSARPSLPQESALWFVFLASAIAGRLPGGIALSAGGDNPGEILSPSVFFSRAQDLR